MMPYQVAGLQHSAKNVSLRAAALAILDAQAHVKTV